jgi:hypothetical protein
MRTTTKALGAVALAACQPDYELITEPPDVDPGLVTECEFTPIPGTLFSEYDCNPVFTATDEAWAGDIGSIAFHTTEVAGHPFYQIWYAADGADGSAYEIGYAVSGDGTNWDAHPSNPLFQATPGAWDEDAMDALQVVWDQASRQYVMSYQGIRLPTSDFDPNSVFGLGIATSGDGVNWTKHPANPVINFSDSALSFSQQPCWPLSLTVQGSSYVSYIAATDPLGGLFGDPRCDVYTATATNLGQWTLGTTPVMSGSAWYDAAGVAAASVVEFEGTQYMFYIGFETWTEAGNGVITATNAHLAMATSVNGVNWVKAPNNPLPLTFDVPGRDPRAVGAQVVGSRIHVWVSDYYEELGEYAVGYFLYEPHGAEAEEPAPAR